MTTPLKLSLKGGQRIYINGAVLRADRNVTFELLNTATFLLAQHIVAAEDARTPLRRLYFMIQTSLIAPQSADTARPMIDDALHALALTFENTEVLKGLQRTTACLAQGCVIDALKTLRALFPIEDSILAHTAAA